MRLPRFLATEWPSLLLPLVPLVIFAPALFGPWVFWQRDISLYWYPQAEAFVRVVSGGSLPLWNPYTSFGLPLLADPSAPGPLSLHLAEPLPSPRKLLQGLHPLST